jgi:hypothetical protein
MGNEGWTIIGTIAGVIGVAVAIVIPLAAWRSHAAQEKSMPNRKAVEQLEQLFETAAYSADVLQKGGLIDEALHVQKFKDASFSMHEIATLLRERNGPDSPIGNAVTAFYEAFRAKESLTICKARMTELKELAFRRRPSSAEGIFMNESEDYFKRANEIADTTRRVLTAFNTGGIGLTYAIAGSLVNSGVSPSWTINPISAFVSGLIIIALSLLLAKHKAIKRNDAVKRKRSEPNFEKWYWANFTYDLLSLLFFVIGVIAGLCELSGIEIPAYHRL